jgi:1-deoxy-D-xylulose-5-phosphate synthase
VGADGETHQVVFDVGYRRQIPGMRIWSPASYGELRDMLKAALDCDGPAAVRYPRGPEGAFREGGAEPLRTLRRGRDVALVSYGVLINEVLEAADLLAAEGVGATVIKLGQLAPLDMKALDSLTYDARGVLVAEEAAAEGCVGEQIAASLRRLPVKLLNLGDGVVRQGTVAQQRRRRGIDAASIAAAAKEMLK